MLGWVNCEEFAAERVHGFLFRLASAHGRWRRGIHRPTYRDRMKPPLSIAYSTRPCVTRHETNTDHGLGACFTYGGLPRSDDEDDPLCVAGRLIASSAV